MDHDYTKIARILLIDFRVRRYLHVCRLEHEIPIFVSDGVFTRNYNTLIQSTFGWLLPHVSIWSNPTSAHVRPSFFSFLINRALEYDFAKGESVELLNSMSTVGFEYGTEIDVVRTANTVANENISAVTGGSQIEFEEKYVVLSHTFWWRNWCILLMCLSWLLIVFLFHTMVCFVVFCLLWSRFLLPRSLFCCCPIGLFAVYNAYKVNRYFDRQEFEVGTSMKNTLTWYMDRTA